MATINTGVPTSLARPQTFHRFTYLSAGGQLTPLLQKVALIGTMKAGGTAVANTVYDILSSEAADALFVAGSEAALMCRDAFRLIKRLGFGPMISAIGVLEPAAGAAATFTLTVGGPATESGNFRIRACGIPYVIGVSKDDTAADIATAIAAAFTAAAADLPFTAIAAAAVVTATYNHKGTNGNALVFSVDSAPKGVTLAVAAGVAGAGALDLTDAYLDLEPIELDAIAPSVNTAADVAVALAHVQAMWQPAEKKWRWVFFGDTTTLAPATPLATAAHDRGIVVGSCEACPVMPFTLATMLAVAAMSRNRPNANYDGFTLPLQQPAIGSAYTGTEVETGIAAGLTILTPVQRGQQVIDGVCKIERMVTTKTTDNNEPFLICRDLGVPRTGAYMARQIDIQYAIQFGADANPDGALLDNDSEAKVRDMVSALWHDAAAANILANVDSDLGELLVQADPDAAGRLDVQTAQTVVVGQHQVAYNHNVKIGGAS